MAYFCLWRGVFSRIFDIIVSIMIFCLSKEYLLLGILPCTSAIVNLSSRFVWMCFVFLVSSRLVSFRFVSSRLGLACLLSSPLLSSPLLLSWPVLCCLILSYLVLSWASIGLWSPAPHPQEKKIGKKVRTDARALLASIQIVPLIITSHLFGFQQ